MVCFHDLCWPAGVLNGFDGAFDAVDEYLHIFDGFGHLAFILLSFVFFIGDEQILDIVISLTYIEVAFVDFMQHLKLLSGVLNF